MGKRSFGIDAILWTIVIILAISLLNYMTHGEVKFFKNFDMPTYLATKIEFSDVSEMFIKSEKVRDTTKYIVVHCDAIDQGIFETLPAFDIEAFHLKKRYKHFAYHLYIGRSGLVYKMHKLKENTNHAGKPMNKMSVSVCLEGNFDNEELEPTQARTLLFTLIELKRRYPLAMIIGHCEVSGKSCPGKNVNMTEIVKAMNIHYIDLNF